MARLTLDEVEKFGERAERRGSWFSLPDDRDVKTVRILAKSVDDLDALTVHKITLGGVKRWISCLRAPGDSVDACPLCAAGLTPSLRIFMQLVDVEDNQLYMWDRGRNTIPKLRSLERRIDGPLYETPIEIERVGRKGDKETTYEFYPTKRVKVAFEDLPEKIGLINGEGGSIVIERSASDLEYFIENGDLPKRDEKLKAPKTKNVEEPIRPRKRAEEPIRPQKQEVDVEEDEEEEEVPVRRTRPAAKVEEEIPTRRKIREF